MIWPPAPYLPGITPRPSKDHFAPLTATVAGCATPGDLAESPCFRAGFEGFARRYYWEAHELWEPVWMTLPRDSTERALVQGLIQLANAALKRRMGRPRAADRIIALADTLFPPAEALPVMGVSGADIRRMHHQARQEVHYSA
ncbi:MAG: hypothetical protein Kow0013_08700 [Pararhodobacter sp.]